MCSLKVPVKKFSSTNGWLNDLEDGTIDSIESNEDRFTQLEDILAMVEERLSKLERRRQ